MTTKNNKPRAVARHTKNKALLSIIALANASNNATMLANEAHAASLQVRWKIKDDAKYSAAVTVYLKARAEADAAYLAWNTAYSTYHNNSSRRLPSPIFIKG